MQYHRSIVRDGATLVGLGLSVMLVAPEGLPETRQKTLRLSGLGCQTTVAPDVGRAVSTMSVEPHDLLMIDAAAFGGIDAARAMLSRMRRAGIDTPAVIVSPAVAEQTFPLDPAEPVVLRAPISAVGLRVAIEFVQRHVTYPAAA